MIEIPPIGLRDDRNQILAFLLFEWNLCLLACWNLWGFSIFFEYFFVLILMSGSLALWLFIYFWFKMRTDQNIFWTIFAVTWDAFMFAIGLKFSNYSSGALIFFVVLITFCDFLLLWWQRRFFNLLKQRIYLEINGYQIKLFSSLKSKSFVFSIQFTEPILSFLGLPMDAAPITSSSWQKSLSENGFCSLRSRLNQAEKEWLAAEIKDYLKAVGAKSR